MPPVTAPMTGRTLAATTTSSVSPKGSGLQNVFLPRYTTLRRENTKNKYNKRKKVVPTESFVRHDLRILHEWRRTPLHLGEGFFDRLLGKKQAVRSQPPAVKPIGVSKAPQNKRTSMVNPAIGKFRISSEHPLLDPRTGQPMYQPKPIPIDAQGNMIPDADYEKVGSGLQQSGVWGQDAPPYERGLTGEPETPNAERSDSDSKAFGSSVLTRTPEHIKRSHIDPAKAPTSPPKKVIGSQSDMKLPGSSQVLVRSSRTPKPISHYDYDSEED